MFQPVRYVNIQKYIVIFSYYAVTNLQTNAKLTMLELTKKLLILYCRICAKTE